MVEGWQGWVVVAGVSLLAGCAGDAEPEGRAVGGTVVGVYEEPVRGILMDRELRTTRDPGASLWVDVRTRAQGPGGTTSILARMEDSEVLTGDFVELLPEIGAPAAPREAWTWTPTGQHFSREAAATRIPSPRMAQVRRGLRVEVDAANR